VTVIKQNVDGLATWQLRDYRRDLEQAMCHLPKTSAQRQVYAGRLAEVISEQEARAVTTGIPSSLAYEPVEVPQS
jgi:hypothetical protein